MRAAKIAATSVLVSLLGLCGGASGDMAPILRPGAPGGAPRATYITKMLTRGDDLVLGRPMLLPGQGTNRPEPVHKASLAASPSSSSRTTLRVVRITSTRIDHRRS